MDEPHDNGKPPAKPPRKSPAQKKLPGAKVHEFPDLNEAMHDYRTVRDRRMNDTAQEVDLKAGIM